MNQASDNQTGGWGKFPAWIVEGGTWADLTSAARAVLVPLVARSDGRTGEVTMGDAELMRKTGLTRRPIQKARQTLQDAGVIDFTLGCGRGHHTHYKIVWKRGQQGAPFDGGKGAAGSADSVEKGRSPGTQKALVDARKGAAGSAPYQKVSEHTESRSRTAAGCAPDQQAIEALEAAGVGEPERSRLAGTPGITADLVRRVAASCNGAGPGLIVTRLRERAAKAVEATQAEERRQQVADWWGGLDPADRDTWLNRVVERWPNLERIVTLEHASLPGWAAKLRAEADRPAEAVPA